MYSLVFSIMTEQNSILFRMITAAAVFATSDYRYIYDSSDIIVATYSSGGSLVGTSDNGEILHPMLYGNNRTFFIETESAYILKDSDDDQVEKFSKDTCTLEGSSNYGLL